MRLRERVLLASLAVLAPGCAAAPWLQERAGVTPAELLAASGSDAPAIIPANSEILAVSAEMREFLDAHVVGSAGRAVRLRQLAHAVVGEETLRLTYDETTRTAAEAFRDRRGNCLSFSNMFVALARETGLDARYQEVDTPPDWSLKDDAFVLNRHVNVLVDLGRDGEHVVDFNMDDFRTSFDRRVISDARAIAHHHSNLGVERMQAGDAAAAFLHLRHALLSDISFSPAWTNLGILYWRDGRLDHAQAAFLEALRADGQDLVAMSNLASLQEKRGFPERATLYRERVARHRQQNPFYRFQLAKDAYLRQDYDAAIDHLRAAVRARRNEDRFYFLLGMAHMRKGDERTARRYMERAEREAATDAARRRYATKMDLLLAGTPGQQRREDANP